MSLFCLHFDTCFLCLFFPQTFKDVILLSFSLHFLWWNTSFHCCYCSLVYNVSFFSWLLRFFPPFFERHILSSFLLLLTAFGILRELFSQFLSLYSSGHLVLDKALRYYHNPGWLVFNIYPCVCYFWQASLLCVKPRFCHIISFCPKHL